jgi:hypothetical protein
MEQRFRDHRVAVTGIRRLASADLVEANLPFAQRAGGDFFRPSRFCRERLSRPFGPGAGDFSLIAAPLRHCSVGIQEENSSDFLGVGVVRVAGRSASVPSRFGTATGLLLWDYLGRPWSSRIAFRADRRRQGPQETRSPEL